MEGLGLFYETCNALPTCTREKMNMYSVHDHGQMITDRVRIGAYRRALEQTVKPGHVVVEIGTGVGLLAVFACRMGARRVYAIEYDEVIELARQVAKDNGCAGQIEFIRGLSTHVALPEKADVIVSDVHGGLPFFSRGLESLIDARHRFLAPYGTMIPLRDRIWTAAVDLPAKAYDEIAVWTDGRWNVELAAGRRFGVDWPIKANLEPAHLVTEPARLASIAYLTLESPSASGSVSWCAAHDFQANGFGVWFDSQLSEGVSLTTAPGAPETAYPKQFAPWSRAVAIRENDRIEAKLSFNYVNGDYVWIWNTRILSPGGELKEEFRQSTLNSMFISAEKLRKRAPGYRPRLTKSGVSGRAILELMDGQRTHAEIARLAMQSCPDAFLDENEALQAVAELSEKFSE